MSQQARPYALGIDIGGTFTDVVIVEADGTVHIGKGISRPDAFERGIFDILDRMTRVRRSSVPPGAVGTTMRTGRF